MKIAISCDHGGFELKSKLTKYLQKKNIKVIDFGCHSEEKVDYPDFAKPVCESVHDKEVDRGILICNSGIGMAITANRFSGLFAAVCGSKDQARYARLHNNINILCLGAKELSEEQAKDIIDVFLETAFEGGRHSRRLEKIG